MSAGSSPSSALSLEMSIKVEGQPEEAFLQHGLTIGRASSNTICLDDPAVERIHARVMKGEAGKLFLRRESPAARVFGMAGDECDQLELRDGLRFRIGSATLVCRKLESNPSGPTAAGNPWLAQCPVCYGSLAGVDLKTPECPRCQARITFYSSRESGFSGWLPIRVGPYRVRAFVGMGGMGLVLRGLHEKNDIPAALKLLRLVENPALARRFLAEAETLRHLAHPNVVTLREHGQDNRMLWLAMDWLDGRTLADILAERKKNREPLDLGEIAEIAGQVAQGLKYLHDQGIIHRDLKPQNIMRSRDNLVKILDFGLAKPAEPMGAATMLTQTGMVAGTAGYMSPEQSEGGALAPASDIYSFGLILYEMLTGRLPVGIIRPLAECGRDCPSGWQSLLSLCLSHNPAERPDANGVIVGLNSLRERKAWPDETPKTKDKPRIVDTWPTAASEPPKKKPSPKISSPGKKKIPRKTPKKTSYLPYILAFCFIAALAPLAWRQLNARGKVEATPAAVTSSDLKPPRSSVADVLAEARKLLEKVSSRDKSGAYTFAKGKETEIAEIIRVLKRVDAIEGAAPAEKAEAWALISECTAQLPKGRNHSDYEQYARLAAEQGHALGQQNLANSYGNKGNLEEALKWRRLSANQGWAEAQLNLGAAYASGQGVKKDAAEAVKWFRLAAEQGYALAQTGLGACYANGNGVPRDDAEAVKWFLLAAEQGHPPAQNELGECYIAGIGVE